MSFLVQHQALRILRRPSWSGQTMTPSDCCTSLNDLKGELNSLVLQHLTPDNEVFTPHFKACSYTLLFWVDTRFFSAQMFLPQHSSTTHFWEHSLLESLLSFGEFWASRCFNMAGLETGSSGWQGPWSVVAGLRSKLGSLSELRSGSVFPTSGPQ